MGASASVYPEWRASRDLGLQGQSQDSPRWVGKSVSAQFWEMILGMKSWSVRIRLLVR